MWNHTSTRKANQLNNRNRNHRHENKDFFDSLDLTQETKNERKLQNQNIIKNHREKNFGEWSKHLDYLMAADNNEQDDDGVDNLLKFVKQRSE